MSGQQSSNSALLTPTGILYLERGNGLYLNRGVGYTGETHQTTHLRAVHFIIWKFNLDFFLKSTRTPFKFFQGSKIRLINKTLEVPTSWTFRSSFTKGIRCENLLVLLLEGAQHVLTWFPLKQVWQGKRGGELSIPFQFYAPLYGLHRRALKHETKKCQQL